MAYLGLRSTFTLLAFQTWATSPSRTGGAGGDLANGNTVHQRGLSVSLSYRLTPEASLAVTASQQDTVASGNQPGNGLRTISATWSSRLGPYTNVSLGVRHAVADSDINPYTRVGGHRLDSHAVLAMYESFYGLTSKPFQLNPDPNFFFGSKQHRRAKAYLEYGVSRNEGFIVITGEIGAGKTTVLRSLIDGLHGTNVIAGHLVTTQLGAEDTLRMVGAAFGFRVKDVPKSELLITLEAFLISQTSKGKRCLLIVDEAQNLSPRAVEELRMLSNFQFGNQALLAELPDRPAGVPRDPAAARDGAVPPAGGGHLPHRPAGPGRDEKLYRAPTEVRRCHRQAQLRPGAHSRASTRPAAAFHGASTRSATGCCCWAT